MILGIIQLAEEIISLENPKQNQVRQFLLLLGEAIARHYVRCGSLLK